MKYLTTPLTDDMIDELQVGDMISVSGSIFTGRDAVLPKLARMFEEDRLGQMGIGLRGSVVFHTAVSPAGVGPTSSNKLEIENSMESLSMAGVKIHLGKGAISKETVTALEKNHAVFAVIPPVTALLGSKILSQAVVAFPEEGMEAFHRLEVDGFTAIIAAAHGTSIYERQGKDATRRID